jgi:hypothetical protein
MIFYKRFQYFNFRRRFKQIGGAFWWTHFLFKKEDEDMVYEFLFFFGKKTILGNKIIISRKCNNKDRRKRINLLRIMPKYFLKNFRFKYNLK